MGSGMPAPQNFGQAAQQTADASRNNVNAQTAANRPNQSSPFASRTWTQGPNGQWMDQTTLNGPLGGLNDSLQQQAAQAMSQPFSLGGLPALTDGAQAREQAINAAYGSATSRLDPAFQQREEQTRTRLQQQGLTPGSEAYERELSMLGRERTDAYGQAMNSAIGQGTQAGQALFGQSMAARQNAMAEALRQRGQAFGELQGLQGLTQQQGFMGAGMAQAPDFLGAAGMQGQQDWGRYQFDQQRIADIIGGGTDLAKSLAPFLFSLCDERAKQEVRYTGETLHGVPLATWRYRPEHGDASVRYRGVLAQDVAAHHPGHVRRRSDGLLEVHPAFAPVAL
jgi:hypothetical protein